MLYEIVLLSKTERFGKARWLFWYNFAGSETYKFKIMKIYSKNLSAKFRKYGDKVRFQK